MSNIKKFYKTAEARPNKNGFGVFLDGRALKTPAKNALSLPTMAAAQIIAAEWDAQIEEIKPNTMPLTRLVNVAIDRTPNTRQEIAAEIKKYASTDLLVYRVKAPEKLARAQADAWDNMLEWARQSLGIDMAINNDSLELVQTKETLEKVYETAIKLDDLRLTILGFLVPLTGSAILGFALLHGAIDAQKAFAAIRIEEEHNAQIWGHDYEDLDKAKEKLADLEAVEKLIVAL